MNRSAKYLKSLVGAPRFELGTSCAQGRRATRLRYAPTSTRSYSSATGDLSSPATCPLLPNCATHSISEYWHICSGVAASNFLAIAAAVIEA